MAIMAAILAVVAPPKAQPSPSRSARMYRRAMHESQELLDRMRRPHPAQAVIAEIVAHQHDTPFLATVFEAAKEAGTPKASTSG